MNSLWFRCLAFAATLGALLAWASWQYTLEVDIRLLAPSNAQAEVFFTQDKGSFVADQRATLIRIGSTEHYTATLVSSQPIQSLRIDPSDKAGEIVLQSATLKGDGGEHRWDAKALATSMDKLQQLALKAATADGLEFDATGDDAQFVLNVPVQTVQIPAHKAALKILTYFLLSCITWLLLEALYRWGNAPGSLLWRAHLRLQNTAKRLSLDGPIVWHAGSLLCMLALFLAAALSVSLKLHQSSIAIWEGMFPSRTVTYSTILGTPRAIRSDEWNTQTPWILNGVQRGMQLENKNVGAEQSALVAATPVLHPTMLAQPKFWGFLFLDTERGFAWLWAYRIFGMLATFFLILLAITKGKTLLSATGSIWVFGSSYVQWWHSNNLGDILVGFGAAVVGAIYLLQAPRTWQMVGGGLVLALALTNLVLHVYPPFMIPLAWLAVLLLTGILLNAEGRQRFVQHRSARIAVAGTAMLLFAALAGTWAWDAKNTIATMLDTVYPGHRISMGGDMALSRVFYGYFESWRIGEITLPFPPTNATEASSFWLMFPLAFLLVPLKQWRAPENRMLLLCLSYCIFLVIWMSAPLPSFVRSSIGHLGWQRATAVRAVLGLGITSIFATVLLLSRAMDEPNATRRIAPIWVIIVVAIAIVALGVLLKPLDAVFLTKWRVLGGALVAALMAFSIQLRSQWLFLLSVLVIISPSITVNPLQSGLKSIFDKPILSLAVEQGSSPSDRWAVVGSFIFSQGLKSRGLDVLTGTNYIPDKASVHILDPAAKYEPVWNRYAHIEIESIPLQEKPEFLLTGTDQYTIRLSVCGPWLTALGVTRLAYTGPPPEEDLKCLRELKNDELSGVRLFERLPSSGR